MTIRYERNTAHFEATCGADEALDFIDWLRRHKAPKVDLAGCDHLHASLLQILLAARPRLVGQPRDAFLFQWVAPMVAAEAERGGAVIPAPRRRQELQRSA
jgi:hypothetical protein